jgi:hypothetical protein
MKPTMDDDDGDLPKLGGHDADEFAPSPLPVGSDGTPKPAGPVGNPEPLPDATPDNWICLRGPCRHYMRIVEAGEFGNTAGTFEADEQPRQVNHWCDAINGSYTDMGNNIVFECNRWDPLDDDEPEVMARERRRSKYLKLYPAHAPISDAEIAKMAEASDEVPDFPEEMKRPPEAAPTTGQGDDHAPGE